MITTRLRCAVFAATVLWVACAGRAPTGEDLPPEARNADDLLVVDCLLPGQVRRLGSQMTYMTPRRPVKTSARDCEIRGGEYVAFDRASYADSLRVWLPAAKEGDAEAQTYVGEIFEKGLGLDPDYAAAAEWYRRAADQGYGPAQINLGQLYENGLGVPRDRSQALQWYRRASGLEDLGFEFVGFVGDAKEYQKLRQELDDTGAEADRLRQDVRGLQAQLSAAQSERVVVGENLDVESEELASLREGLQAETEALRAEADGLAAERADLAERRSSAERAGRSLTDLRAAEVVLAERQTRLDEMSSALEAREAQIAERQAQLAASERSIRELDAETERLRLEAEERRQQYASAVAPVVTASLPGPSIHLVDPAVLLTRSARSPTASTERKVHTIVGKIDAPAGLMSLMVNNVEASVADDGFFEIEMRVRRGGTPVSVVAIDQQGKRADRAFTLRRGDATSTGPVSVPMPAPNIQFGRYYALVIGNSEYQHMQNLRTASTDAEMVATLLDERYGFDVRLLVDADRYEILSALNNLRQELGDQDNLIVYYAGHGELDEVNERGYWLPVDAEEENPTQWISNVAITDLLNAMKAKHIMVIADSCYSGVLTATSLAAADDRLDDESRAAWQRAMVSKRSRTALTSGGLAPVLDGGGGDNSVFARAFIDVLRENDDVLEGSRLFEELAARVTYQARTRGFRQEPQYAPIRYGRHEVGDFFFVPRG